MILRIYFFALGFLMFSVSNVILAQDMHWSQFNDNPIFQNPGNAGRFQGDYRFHANYKDQWRSVTVPFTTLSLSADTRLQRNPNVGVGFLFSHDQVGDGKFKTIEFLVAPSILLNLSGDSTHTLRPGFHIGLNNRQVNASAFYFDAQFDGIMFNPSLPTNEALANQKFTNLALAGGMVYEYIAEKRKKISAGIGVFNLNRPIQTFYGSDVQRDIRINIFAKAQYEINDDWDALPTFMLNFQGKYREIILGGTARRILIDRLGEYRALYFGAYFRNRDATYLSVGMDYQNWFAGLSYDVNFSKLVPASNLRGGLELSLRYVITRFKPKKVIHRVCPDYI
jgi:type IX secretion system PorP/SprF family membrane protein